MALIHKNLAICRFLIVPLMSIFLRKQKNSTKWDRPELKHRETLYLVYGNSIRGVRDDRFKLIEYVVGDDQNTQLFDLKKDPWELNNLVDKPEYADKLKFLKQELLRLRDEWDDKSHPTGKIFWDDYKIN